MTEPEEIDEEIAWSETILLVDDNPTNIDVLYNFLNDHGYEVLVAEDGMSALERVTYAKPDLILLDIMMPRMGGFEVCEKLKEDPETRDIPIIFLTALGSVDDKVKGFEMGGVDYITKPFQNQEILARISSHMELQRMRAALKFRNERLETQNEALEAYARTVAHDLKNPLNLILNFARFIEQEGVLEGQSAEDLKRILNSAETMNHIIRDLLLLAQMRDEVVQRTTLDMQTVVESALDRLHVEIQKRDALLHVPDVWPKVEGNASWIQGVWVNYISNALKYGGTPPMVKLFWEEHPERHGWVWFGVEDNGEGLRTANADELFREFSRSGEETEEGHGIGLSICRRILHRLGGEVSAESVPEGGSRFLFLLPMAK